MDEEKLDTIKQLMEELIEEMQPSGEDFDMRLGKPKVEVMKMDAGSDPDMDMDDDSMGEDSDDEMDMDHEMGSPDDMLRKRLMRLKA